MPCNTTYKIAAIPGDGIGVDVTDAAHKGLDTLASAVGTFSFQWETFNWNSYRYHKTGEYMQCDWGAQLRSHDAIFFGAVGWATIFNVSYKLCRLYLLTPDTSWPLSTVADNVART